MIRKLIQCPDFRNNGKYQFVVGYGGGMQTVECIHLEPSEISARLEAREGLGRLVDDGVNLWWEQDQPIQEATGL